jgi:hypothetical protein
MNRFGLFVVAAVGLAGVGHAADLPITKGPPSLAPGCFWTWLDATAADCPPSYSGFTVYATLAATIAKGPRGTRPSFTAHKG